MANRITCLTIDCADPGRLASFWAEALNWKVTDSDHESAIIGATGYPFRILFLTVPEPKQAKNRVHLEVSPTDGDQETELRRLLGLGARPADIGQGDVSWHVLADPEGNEFCLMSRRVDPV